MERTLQKCLDDISQVAGVKGFILSDAQGLCLGMKGKVTPESSGVITSITQQVRMLEPENPKPPLIILESESRQCFIKEYGHIISALYKSTSP